MPSGRVVRLVVKLPRRKVGGFVLCNDLLTRITTLAAGIHLLPRPRAVFGELEPPVALAELAH